MKTNAVNIRSILAKRSLQLIVIFYKDLKEIKIILQSINVKLGFLEI